MAELPHANESTPSLNGEMLHFLPALEAARRRTVPHSSRYLVYGLSLTFFLLVVWAAFADLEETVMGSGQVIPSQRVQHIQNLEGGILREIVVTEGQTVEKNDLLLRIDNVEAGSIYRDSVVREVELRATVVRLNAELSGNDPLYPEDMVKTNPELIVRHNQLLEARRSRVENERLALTSQLELRTMEEQELIARKNAVSENLALAEKQRDMAKKLMATRSYSEMEYLGLQQMVAQLSGEIRVLESSIPKARAAIREGEEKLHMHASTVRANLFQELNVASTELAAVREAIITHKDKFARTEVRSPVRGVIKHIAITTTGGVIMPGQIIMDVVPSDDSLIIEARILPQDRAFLFSGQKARIRLSAYDFAIYGAMDAVLEHISADTIEGRQGEIFYLARLHTLTTTLEHNGRQLPILPGMMATVDVITGKRTVLDYVLKPLMKARQEALREP